MLLQFLRKPDWSINIKVNSKTVTTKNAINIITVWQLHALQLKIGGRHIKFKPQTKFLNFHQQVGVVGSGRFPSFLCCPSSVSVKDILGKKINK